MSVMDIHTTVGELVTQRPSRSRIFEKLGIDYCCGGKKPLAEVCQKKGLDPQTVLQVLEAAESTAADAPTVNPDAMGLAELADHIEQTHHAYLRQELPRLEAMISKVAAVHGNGYPWMSEVEAVFAGFKAELGSHMMKEEQILFPAIRSLERGEQPTSLPCPSIAGPIQAMEHEHDGAGDALARMRELTSDYTPPEEACNTFRATLDGLAELEANMHQHVHKENNILFPKALRLEDQA